LIIDALALPDLRPRSFSAEVALFLSKMGKLPFLGPLFAPNLFRAVAVTFPLDVLLVAIEKTSLCLSKE
jgi:hypothetical protein